MKKQNLLIIYLFLIFLFGCNGNSGESELQHPDKGPESLNEVSSAMDEISMSLDEIERLYMNLDSLEEDDQLSETADTESDEGQGQEEEENRQEGNSSEEDSNQGDNSEENGGSASSEETSGQEEKPRKTYIEIRNEEIVEIWKNIESTVEEIHGYWDDYLLESQTKPVSKDQLNSFENALNKLTLAISKKDIMGTYQEMADGYSKLSPVFGLYQDDIMGELTSIKHNVYNSYAKGIDSLANGEIYNRMRHKLDDESKNDLINKLENSVNSFKLALVENSRRVNMIKKNIVLENISELGD